MIHRSLNRASVGLLATKKPIGLLRTEGKRPDGLIRLLLGEKIGVSAETS